MTFLGRNGHFKCTGIEVEGRMTSMAISPITSQDMIGRCEIQIPMDKVRYLIDALQQVFDKEQQAAKIRK